MVSAENADRRGIHVSPSPIYHETDYQVTRLENLVVRQSPYTLVKTQTQPVERVPPDFEVRIGNPWLYYQVRMLNQRGIRVLNPSELARYTINWGGWVPAGASLIAALFACGLSSLGLIVLVFIFYGSLGFGIISNIYYAIITINSVRLESGLDWDLLRITLLPERDIIAAQYAIVQLRAWRVMVVEIGLRVFVVTVTLIVFLYFAFVFSDRTATNSWDVVVQFFVPIILFAMTYVLGPLWRMRAITGLATALGRRISNATSAFVAAFLALLGMLIVQGVIVIWLTEVLINQVFVTSEVMAQRTTAIALITWIVDILIGPAILYLFYRLIQAVSIRWAVRTLRRGA